MISPEEILGIKRILGAKQLEEIQQVYVTKAPHVAQDKEDWQKKSRSLQMPVRWLKVPELQDAVEASGITRGWIEATNHVLN